MQEVQTFLRLGVRPSRIRMRWMFGSQRRGCRLWEKLTDMPKPGRLPQMSHTAAMAGPFVGCCTGKDKPRNGSTAASLPATRPAVSPGCLYSGV